MHRNRDWKAAIEATMKPLRDAFGEPEMTIHDMVKRVGALTRERDQNCRELAMLRAEVERWKGQADMIHKSRCLVRDRSFAAVAQLRKERDEASAEVAHAIEQAAQIIGSEHRNVGVITAALDWLSKSRGDSR